MKHLVAALLTVILVVASPLPTFSTSKKSVSKSLIRATFNQPNSSTDRLIVKYKKRSAVKAVKVESSQSFSQVVRKLKDNPKIEYVEPDYWRKASLQPNDQHYSLQWGLSKIQAPSGWDIEAGESNQVIIAVVDTGVDLNHPDLSGKLVAGADIVEGDNVPQDDNGHGTHVAGIAAASGNNGIGVAGVGLGSNIKIMPIKVLDYSGGGYDSWVAEGVRAAVDRGANIINLSLGGSGYSQTLQEATDYALANNVLVIAASGNTGDSTVNYPAGNPNVLGVGATDQNDQVADFSTYNGTVDVSAPGVDIASTYWYYGRSVYAYSSGTSMATPFVTGLASLIKSKWPEYSASQISSRITDLSDDLGSLGRDNYYGAGRINIYNSLNPNISVASVRVKNKLTVGQKTILRGFIRPASANRQVQISHRALSKKWTFYKQTQTDGNGNFAIAIKPSKNTYYKIYSPAVDTYSEASSTVKVNVVPKVNYKVKRISAKKIRIWGSIKPAKGINSLVIKMVVRGKWRGAARVRIKGGRFAINMGKKSGYYRIKVVLPASKSFAGVSTKEKRLR